jgi:DNA-binding CsgD family transcriptional regulator
MGKAQPAPRLSPRELDILQLIADGHGNADIARTLGCSPHTVKNTIYDLMGRLHLRNRVHAAAYAVREGLV